MKYEDLIETISEIVQNPKIFKTGLIISYELSEKNHRQMNEELFYKANPITATFEDNDEFEVEIGGILVKFIKEKTKIVSE